MTTLLTGLRLANPNSVEEAIAACRDRPGSRFVAGGTDLLVNMRHGLSATEQLIDLSGIDELTMIATNGGGVTIGAGVTVAALARSPGIAAQYRALAEAAAGVAGPGHRNMATVGGNLCQDTRCIYYNQSEWWRNANSFCLKHRGEICHVAPQGKRCHAAYSGDLAPALLVLGAAIEIAGPQGRRTIPLSELYVEDGLAHLALAEGELILAIQLPPAPPPSAYTKVRVRGAIDFPLAGVAVALATADAKVASLQIALTGTNSRPFVVAGTQDFAGRAVDEYLLKEIERLVQKQAQPMRTTIASANYRRVAAAALARRLTARLFAESAV